MIGLSVVPMIIVAIFLNVISFKLGERDSFLNQEFNATKEKRIK